MTSAEPQGIHHVTAIARDPQSNVDFYTRVQGLRLVKQTVNFDAPDSYHLYYGDEQGSPSSLLTFFPWPGVPKGRQGAGLSTTTAFSVPGSSLGWWHQRLQGLAVDADAPTSTRSAACTPAPWSTWPRASRTGACRRGARCTTSRSGRLTSRP